MPLDYSARLPEIVAAVQRNGTCAAAARELSASGPYISETTVRKWWRRHQEQNGTAAVLAPAPTPTLSPKLEPASDLSIAATALLRKGAYTLEEVAARLNVSRGRALDICDELKARGVNLHELGGRFSVERDILPGSSESSPAFSYPSSPSGEYLFGVVADTHLGSKYERLDVLNDLYDLFKKEGVERVYHCGNYIEGEARFNKFDINIYGMDAQVRYFCEQYPRRQGITTYFVAGDDHEGWYVQREGVDIGRYTEMRAREWGRDDLVYLGYMEAFVALHHARTGNVAQMLVCHPGGGSSYADSYVVQKILESYEGGEKPGVAWYGHYHKMLSGEYRNVWWGMPGCTKDQDVFARKKRLRYVVGGMLAWMKQDERGFLPRFRAESIRYFSRSFYNNQWSMTGPVTQAPMLHRFGEG